MAQYQDLFRLDNKIAVVTGGAGILGSEFCNALCALGATVACLDVHEESLHKVVKELQDKYGNDKIAGFVCDVSDTTSVNQAVNDVIKCFSRIDILLNNAA